ncbi:MAG: hypothetical protein R3C53_10820 [Pirellulaceae bacterium]
MIALTQFTKDDSTVDNLKPIVLLGALFSCFQCYSQEVLVVELVEKPANATEKWYVPQFRVGKVQPSNPDGFAPERGDNIARLPGSLDALAAAGSLREQYQVFYRRCPGLITAFDDLRKRPEFDMRFPNEEAKAAFGKLMDEAVASRQKLCSAYELKAKTSSTLIVKNAQLMEQMFELERLSDAKLSELISELVPPRELPRYFTALGGVFEFQVLTSKLYHDFTTQPVADYRQRLRKAQTFCKWSLEQQLTPEKDIEKTKAIGQPLIAAVYEDLTVQEFLKLKFLFGKSVLDEDLASYLSRTKSADTSIYVSAIKNAKK